MLVLRYMEVGAEVGRALMVLKMRESDHEKRLASYEINADGFRVTGAVAHADGILGGPSLRAGDIDEVLDEEE